MVNGLKAGVAPEAGVGLVVDAGFGAKGLNDVAGALDRPLPLKVGLGNTAVCDEAAAGANGFGGLPGPKGLCAGVVWLNGDPELGRVPFGVIPIRSKRSE